MHSLCACPLGKGGRRKSGFTLAQSPSRDENRLLEYLPPLGAQEPQMQAIKSPAEALSTLQWQPGTWEPAGVQVDSSQPGTSLIEGCSTRMAEMLA